MSNVELDLREQLVRIDNAIAETRKLQEESDKYAAETHKLRCFPWLQLLTIVVSSAAIGAVVARLMH